MVDNFVSYKIHSDDLILVNLIPLLVYIPLLFSCFYIRQLNLRREKKCQKYDDSNNAPIGVQLKFKIDAYLFQDHICPWREAVQDGSRR
jgi:hypothetical protein